MFPHVIFSNPCCFNLFSQTLIKYFPLTMIKINDTQINTDYLNRYGTETGLSIHFCLCFASTCSNVFICLFLPKGCFTCASVCIYVYGCCYWRAKFFMHIFFLCTEHWCPRVDNIHHGCNMPFKKKKARNYFKSFPSSKNIVSYIDRHF